MFIEMRISNRNKYLSFAVLVICAGLFEFSESSSSESSANCFADVIAHVGPATDPVSVSFNCYIADVALTIPDLKPDQGWAVVYSGSSGSGVDLALHKYIGNDGNRYSFDCDYALGSNNQQYTMYPCRPESPDFVKFGNLTMWVAEIEQQARWPEHASMAVHIVETPAVQQLTFGTLDFKAGFNSPVIFQFSTAYDVSSIYLFINFGTTAYVRITKSKCSDIVFASNVAGYIEQIIEVMPSETYFLYVAPTSRDNVAISQMIYPLSQCSEGVKCDKEGGICYENKCTCKQGFYGDQCQWLACDAVVQKPCHCAVKQQITTTSAVIDKADYYSFKKPTPGCDGNGWAIKVDAVSYWTKYYFSTGVNSEGNNCPRGTTVVPVMETEFTHQDGVTNTVWVGLRPCSEALVKYSCVEDYIMRVDGDIKSPVSVVSIPAPVVGKMEKSVVATGVIDDWHPVLYELQVPSGIVNANVSFSFNTNGSIYHKLTIMLKACDLNTITSVVDFDNLTDGRKAIKLTAGEANYLMFTSQYAPSGGIQYKFTVTY